MGSAQCVFGAPGVFELDDDGVSTVVDVGAATEDDVIAAGQRCPANAISVRRDGETLT